MKITKSIVINQPMEKVWDLVANQFDKAYLWMTPIPHSVGIGEGKSLLGAPMQGRICDLSNDSNGPKVREIITQFSEQEKSLSFDVLPVNNPAIVPIKQNKVQMSVQHIGRNQTRVIWTASPQLKTFAYLFYPILRLIFPFAFGKLLKGLKNYAENPLPQAQIA